MVGALTACSVKRTAVDIVGNAISGGAGSYASDDDPELIREALPFGLKTYESLLEVSPEHQALLLSAARGYTAYQPVEKASLTGFHATAKHIAAKAVSPSSETMRTI